jgi:prepilin-type N-terminal cleavage/methylation domain-containing protein
MSPINKGALSMMFFRTRKSVRGFTLMEILVVIAIIMLLGGMLMPAMMRVKVNAQKARAKADVKQLDVALKAVLSDYHDWTPLGGVTSSNIVGNTMISFLNGSDLVANTKGVCYMEFDRASLNGTGFIDPWKQYYNYALGNNGQVLPTGASLTAIPRPMVAWSVGPGGGITQFVTSW